MKIIELLSEQGTIGSVGSTSGPTQPISSTTNNQPNPNNDPKMKQLSATLSSAGIAKNDSEVSDFLNAYSAKLANPNQEITDPKQANMIAKLAVAKDPNLDIKIKQQIQSLGKNNQMGQQPKL